jgi:hypothetical protein
MLKRLIFVHNDRDLMNQVFDFVIHWYKKDGDYFVVYVVDVIRDKDCKFVVEVNDFRVISFQASTIEQVQEAPADLWGKDKLNKVCECIKENLLLEPVWSWWWTENP